LPFGLPHFVMEREMLLGIARPIRGPVHAAARAVCAPRQDLPSD
jgi:hypothetical protein